MDEIRIYPDPVLRKKAFPVKNIDGRVKEIADRMAEAMYSNKGIGLAAPQIGILSQIVVVDLGEGLKTLINPEMIEGEGESTLEEGCLSLPDIEVLVKRKNKVFIQAWDVKGKELRLELSDFPARVYQHEIDHLRGILIIHHISQLKRELLVKKMLKKLKGS
ncbi:MAG: peptide deformylase [Syntrophaceae bacterium]|nr:peptide deformylase [Syntrophaceae bacterium]